jgi:hypothetical protein
LIPYEKIALKCSERLKKWPLGDPHFGDPRYFPKKLSLGNFTEILPSDARAIIEGNNALFFTNFQDLNVESLRVHSIYS